MRRKRLLELASILGLVFTASLCIPGARYWSDYRNRLPRLLTLARRVRPLPDIRSVWLRGGPSLQSPDGKWELRFSPGGGESEWVARARDGSRTVRRRLPSGEFWASASNPLWMPDSRSWVTLTGGEKSLYAVMQGLDTPEVQARTALGYPRGTVVWPDLMGSTLLGCTGPRRVLATPNTDRSPRRGKPRSIPFYAFDVGAGPAHLVQYAVTLPEGRDAGEVALSPEGKRLAWLLHEVPEVHDAPGPLASVQVAVSGTDGTSMQVLAILRRKEFGEERNAPRKLHWSPDGKEIRFSFAGFEWAAPAPEQP